MQQVQGHCCNLLCMVWSPNRQTPNHHICIAYGFNLKQIQSVFILYVPDGAHKQSSNISTHLINIVRIYQCIKTRIKVIQQIDHLKWTAMGSNCCESYNITKIDCNLGKLFRINGQPHFKLFCNRTEIKRKTENLDGDHIVLLPTLATFY
jgi:hypothetical protein